MSMVRFDQIARECRETFKGSFEGRPIVGLEHIEPYDMLLKDYDVDVETTFTKSFKKGQILFGRRRAYQHKACVATCDGICSGDITVIEPIDGAVFPDLLPFIIQNDNFFEHAIKGSNGALSPRVKWEHMANYEVNLPSIDVQKVLAEKLWAAYEVKQSYLKMIDATQEMVKSQFIEMFGKESYKDSLCNIANIVSGKTLPLDIENEGGEIAYLKVADLNLKENERVISTSTKFVKYNTALKSGLIPVGSTIFPKNGAAAMHNKKRITSIQICVDMNTMAVYPKNKELVNPEYLYAFMNSKDLNDYVLIGAIPQIRPKELAGMMVAIPTMEQQEKYVSIMHQADKSKAELRKSIDAIDKVIKSLINENL